MGIHPKNGLVSFRLPSKKPKRVLLFRASKDEPPVRPPTWLTGEARGSVKGSPQARADVSLFTLDTFQGCGIKGLLPTSVIQGNPPLYEENSLWEALSVYHRSGHSPQPWTPSIC